VVSLGGKIGGGTSCICILQDSENIGRCSLSIQRKSSKEAAAATVRRAARHVLRLDLIAEMGGKVLYE